MSETDPWQMTPAEATAKLAEMQAAHDARTAPKNATDAASARAKLDALGKDPNFLKKLEAGDVATKQEFKTLAEQAAGDDGASTLDRVLAGATEPATLIETTTDLELTTRETASAVAELRERGFSPKAIREIFSGEKLTPEQVATATHLKERALRDPAFTKAYLAAEPEAVEAMSLWNAIIVAGVKEDSA